MFSIAIFDILFYFFDYLLSFVTRFGGINISNWYTTMGIFPYSAMFLIITMYLFDLYNLKHHKTVFDLTANVVLSNVIILVLTMSISFWIRAFSVPRGILIEVFIINTLISLIVRGIYMNLHHKRHLDKRLLIVGSSGDEINYLESQVLTDPVMSKCTIIEKQ